MNNNHIFGEGYYENVRPEIIELVDKDVKFILDVGCGKGYLGSKLKSLNPNCKVIGIEYVEEIAQQAKSLLDEVIVGDIQNIDLKFDKFLFDGVIFADILEHLVDPIGVLIRLKPYLKPGGFIITSIPNMRHYTVILRLIRRGWIYDNYGHFDKTHIRFFSLQSMEKLITNAGYVIETKTPRIVASKKMQILDVIAFGKLQEFLAFQYIIKARNYNIL